MPKYEEKMPENYTPEGMAMGSHKSVSHKSSHTGEGTKKEIGHQELCDQCNKKGAHVTDDGPMGS